MTLLDSPRNRGGGAPPRVRCILIGMSRLLRVAMLALLLGPQVGPVLMPPETLCEERQDCCSPDGACDATCVVCACCLNRLSTTVSDAGPEPLDIPPILARAAASAVPLSPPPAEIQHVPKSISG